MTRRLKSSIWVSFVFDTLLLVLISLSALHTALNADPGRIDIKTKLAEVYEITGQLQLALGVINEGLLSPPSSLP
jgi:hypothetical protein